MSSSHLRAASEFSGPDVLSGVNADGTPVSWFEGTWPFFSWAIFLFGAGILAARSNNRDRHWYGWLAPVAYCLHQSEEHAYDLRGWRYSFVPSLNSGPIGSVYQEACKHAGDALSCPLDPKITLYVNVLVVWLGFGGCMAAAALAPKRFLLAGSLNWGTAVINGLMGHVLPAVLTSSYNPGLVQSLFMVPLGAYLILESGRPGLCLVNGFLMHAMLVLGINLIFRFHTGEALTMSVLMVGSSLFLPLAISDYISSSSSSNTTTSNEDENKKQ